MDCSRSLQSECGIAGACFRLDGAVVDLDADNSFRQIVWLVGVVRRHLGLEPRHDGEYTSYVIADVIAPHVHRYVANSCNLRADVRQPTTKRSSISTKSYQ